MQTDDLIDSLADDVAVIPRAEPQRRLAFTALAGAVIALCLVAAWLGFRSDLPEAMGGTVFWVKAGYTAALAAAFFYASERLSRPGVAATRAWVLALVIVAVFAGLGLVQWIALTPVNRLAAIEGVSWRVCTRNILVLGAPATVICLLAMRGLAPTRPTAAGFAGGAFSGAVAASVYGLHCPEAPFIFTTLWYTLGIAACGALGAVLGRRFLRW
jgi:hypothetical protein